MHRTLSTTLALAGLLGLAGCASTYQLTLMPRDSGKTYSGVMEGLSAGQGPISVTIDGKTYSGTWVESAPAYTTGWVSGGIGIGHRGWGGWGGGATVHMDTPGGGAAKALLTSSDGAGLRCDLRGTRSGGGGECRDDKGKEYDVQIRLAAAQAK
ncbi:MAG TPA: hypothetical protein VFV90_08305 [Usitatibacter sp.]|nr:hypothetical protein [Usitatibacter sp.]